MEQAPASAAPPLQQHQQQQLQQQQHQRRVGGAAAANTSIDWTKAFMAKAMQAVEPMWKALHPEDTAGKPATPAPGQDGGHLGDEQLSGRQGRLPSSRPN